MATDSINNSQAGSVFEQLNASLNATKATEKPKNNELGKDAFIKMLVEQLKNQDPTEPIKNEELAVNLAQFSQVEQLVEINKKLEGGGVGDTASLAAFLGREVTVDGNTVEVQSGNGGSVNFELPVATQSGTLQVLDGGGNVVHEKTLGAMGSGRQTVSLNGLGISDGSYSLNLEVISSSGENFSPNLSSGGVVTGFIPGADPTLLVGNREVKVADIKVVNTPSA